ncbi:MAG TPA: hypothetical protein VJ727_11980 [Rhodanobacteraceae bacterium]|nr:hypothetical protein [Rhodanobacteraceae bacterium]
MNSDAALAAALRALPAATPPRDGWELFAARVDRRRRVRTTLRIAVPAALAAGVALAVGLPHLQPARSPVPRVAQQAAPKHVPVTDLDALREQSRRLQAWVQTLDRGGAPLDGDALASAVALQDRIGLVDLQLSAARDPDTRAALWQQRNELLQRLGLLHLQTYAVAEHLRATPSETTIL